MDHLLAWENLIFYIPLAAGLLLVFGSAFSGGHHDVGHDHDSAPSEQGHGHVTMPPRKALSILGVGRVPLTILLMIVALLFGGIGTVINMLLSAIGLRPGHYGWISLVGAIFGTLVLTGPVVRLIRRILPTTETWNVTRQAFAGCTGTLLLPADRSTGLAQVKDPEGNVHNIRCRTIGGALSKGTEILVVEYEEDTRTYVVDTNPVARM